MKHITLSYGQRVKIPGSTAARCIEFFSEPDENDNNRLYAFVVNPGVTLIGDYPGKAEYIARERAAHDAAPLIEEGDIIQVKATDAKFIAHINGTQYTDAVTFKRI